MKIFELLKRFDTGMGAALLLFLTSGSSFFFSPYSTDLNTFLPTERQVNTISWFKDLGKGFYPFGVLLVEEFCTFKVLIISTLLRFIGIILMWLTVDSYITVTQPLLILCGFAFGASSAELVIRHFLRHSCMKKFSKNSLKHFLIIATGYTSLSPSFLIQIDLKFFENVDYKRLLMLALFPGLVTVGLSPVVSRESNDDGHSAFIGVAIVLAVILAVKPLTEAHKKVNITLTVLLYSLWVSNILIGLFYSSRKRPEEEIEKKVTADQKGKTRKWSSWNKGNLKLLYSIDFIILWAAGAVGIAITTTVVDNLRLVTESLSNDPTNLNQLISMSAFSSFLGKILSSYFSLFLLKKKISPSLVLFITLFISTICLALVAFPILLLNTYLIFFFISLCHGAQLMLVSMIFKFYFKKIFYFLYSILRLSVPLFTYVFKIVILSSFYEKSALQQLPPFQHFDFKNTCIGLECFQKTFTIFSAISGTVAILWVIVFIRERKKAAARTEENKGVTDSDSPSPSRSLS